MKLAQPGVRSFPAPPAAVPAQPAGVPALPARLLAAPARPAVAPAWSAAAPLRLPGAPAARSPRAVSPPGDAPARSSHTRNITSP